MVKALTPWRYTEKLKIGCSFGVSGSNAAADRGIAYHRKVFKALEKAALDGFALMVEPWFQQVGTGKFCQPDSLFIDRESRLGIVVEVKLNWKDGRDEKLHNTYLPAVKSAFELDFVWPLLITQNLRGYEYPPLLGLADLVDVMAWETGKPTPLMLLP